MKGLLSFGFPFLLKIIIPGAVGAVTLCPLTASTLVKLGIYSESLTKALLLSFTLLTFPIGFTLYFLEEYIYKILEGYILWPKGLRNYFTNRLNRKIKKKLEKAESSKDEIEGRNLWDWLMRFPLRGKREKPETEAILPTRIGNIMWSYENYPESRYGIEAIFYWPRLWLALDGETRKEINTIWAEADCLTYISFFLFWSFLFNFSAFILDILNIPSSILGFVISPVDSGTVGKIVINPIFFLAVGIVSLFSSYLFYLMSLPLHIRNGNFFQSLFDLHRGKLKDLIYTKKYQAPYWKETWAYLRYGQKKCDKCLKYFPSYIEICPFCKNDELG